MMNLLLITRKVNPKDPAVGFVGGWIASLARSVEHLYVVTWQQSDSAGLPHNVTLHSLSGSTFVKVLTLTRMLWRLLPAVDGVFSHMNPEYAILAAPVAYLRHKRVVAWYTHKSVTLRRWLMEIMVWRIATASRESFRRPLFPVKVKYIGHGIDMTLFSFHGAIPASKKLLIIGRLSPTKRIELAIEALTLLADSEFRLDIIGAKIMEADRAYEETLKDLVREKHLESRVTFVGPISHHELLRFYQSAVLFINVSETGSIDKVVLEALASGCLVVTSNEAFQDLVPAEFFVTRPDAATIAKTIEHVLAKPTEERLSIARHLRSVVAERHSLDTLGIRLTSLFSS